MTLAAPAQAGDDFQTWQSLSLRWWNTERLRMVTSLHTRFVEDSSEFSLYRIGHRVTTFPTSWLQTMIGYRYGEAPESNVRQHRGELQATLHRPLGEHFRIGLRNRFEVRGTEGVGELNERFRHRLRLSLPVARYPPLRSLFINEEVIYDLDRGAVSESRLVPLGFQFQLSPRVGFRLYYLLRSRRSAGDWDHSHVLSTGLDLSL
jgi:hypothetical protein